MSPLQTVHLSDRREADQEAAAWAGSGNDLGRSALRRALGQLGVNVTDQHFEDRGGPASRRAATSPGGKA